MPKCLSLKNSIPKKVEQIFHYPISPSILHHWIIFNQKSRILIPGPTSLSSWLQCYKLHPIYVDQNPHIPGSRRVTFPIPCSASRPQTFSAHSRHFSFSLTFSSNILLNSLTLSPYIHISMFFMADVLLSFCRELSWIQVISGFILVKADSGCTKLD